MVKSIICVFIAIAFFIFALCVYGFQDLPHPELQYQGAYAEYSTSSLELKKIKNFDSYNVNDLNPFVPYHLRDKEEGRGYVQAEGQELPQNVNPEVSSRKDSTQNSVPAYVMPLKKLPRFVGYIEKDDELRILIAVDGHLGEMSIGQTWRDWKLIEKTFDQVTFIGEDGIKERVFLDTNKGGIDLKLKNLQGVGK